MVSSCEEIKVKLDKYWDFQHYFQNELLELTIQKLLNCRLVLLDLLNNKDLTQNLISNTLADYERKYKKIKNDININNKIDKVSNSFSTANRIFNDAINKIQLEFIENMNQLFKGSHNLDINEYTNLRNKLINEFNNKFENILNNFENTNKVDIVNNKLSNNSRLSTFIRAIVKWIKG